MNKGVIQKIGLQVQTSQGVGSLPKLATTVIVDFNNEFGKSFNFKIIVRKITKNNRR